MKRLAWALISIVGCGVADEPPQDEGRTLADFDPAEYEILDMEQLEARDIVVEIDGDRVELASVVDGDWIVLPRAIDSAVAPDGAEAEPAGASADPGLTASIDPQAACPCFKVSAYEVPVTEWVTTCVVTSKNGATSCTTVPFVVVHEILCQTTCGACGTLHCWDDGIAVPEPAPEYGVSTHWFPCYPNGTCGGD